MSPLSGPVDGGAVAAAAAAHFGRCAWVVTIVRAVIHLAFCFERSRRLVALLAALAHCSP